MITIKDIPGGLTEMKFVCDFCKDEIGEWQGLYTPDNRLDARAEAHAVFMAALEYHVAVAGKCLDAYETRLGLRQ